MVCVCVFWMQAFKTNGIFLEYHLGMVWTRKLVLIAQFLCYILENSFLISL